MDDELGFTDKFFSFFNEEQTSKEIEEESKLLADSVEKVYLSKQQQPIYYTGKENNLVELKADVHYSVLLQQLRLLQNSIQSFFIDHKMASTVSFTSFFNRVIHPESDSITIFLARQVREN